MCPSVSFHWTGLTVMSCACIGYLHLFAYLHSWITCNIIHKMFDILGADMERELVVSPSSPTLIT